MQKEIIKNTRAALVAKKITLPHQTVRAVCAAYETAKAAHNGRRSKRTLTSEQARKMNAAKKARADN